MSFSIIIPVYNEEESIGFVLDELQKYHPEAEIIVVDDGSTDKSREIVRTKNVCLIAFDTRNGQSHATWHGIQNAANELCILMDGDGECDPRDICKLIDAAKTADFVCGFRINRKRSVINRAASRIANWTRRLFTLDSARDTGAMKLIRKHHLAHLHLFDGMHRFIPSLLEAKKLSGKEVLLSTRKRIGGKTKYTISKRALHGIRDLYTVRRLMKHTHHE